MGSRKKYKFKMTVVSSYEDRAPEGNTVYNEEGGNLNHSSVGSEGTKFAIVHHDDGFKLKFLKSHEDRVEKNKWIYNEDGGNVNYSSVEDEATVFQRVIVDGDAGHFKLQYVASYEDRVPEGKWLYNEGDGQFNYSSVEDEAVAFKNFNKHDWCSRTSISTTTNSCIQDLQQARLVPRQWPKQIVTKGRKAVAISGV